MPTRSCEMISEFLTSAVAVRFEDLQAALGNASRATIFRYLKQVPYQRSYNHNGCYYTCEDPARYDRFGLFSCGDIHFSRDRTLSETIKRLVHESVAGWTSRELQDVLHVRVQVLLLAAVRSATVVREKLGGFYVYVHADGAVRALQLQRRREQIMARERAPLEAGVADELIIAVLLTLLHHPESKAADVVRYLRGRSPPISMQQVDAVFARYDLDHIGKKGGGTKS